MPSGPLLRGRPHGTSFKSRSIKLGSKSPIGQKGLASDSLVVENHSVSHQINSEKEVLCYLKTTLIRKSKVICPPLYTWGDPDITYRDSVEYAETHCASSPGGFLSKSIPRVIEARGLGSGSFITELWPVTLQQEHICPFQKSLEASNIGLVFSLIPSHA